jgi:hypothetical protein
MLALTFVGCSRVEPNYVGVLMENYGKQGKDDFSLQKGRVWTLTPGTELYQVPLWEQRAKFEAPINLNASNNTAFTTLPVYSFSIIEKRAVDVVFDNKQIGGGSGFIQSLQDNVLEPKIFDIMNEQSRKLTTDELMADGGSLKFEETVQSLVKEEFERRGLKLITFSSKLSFSAKVTAKIDNRNEVNTNVTVLEQKILEQKKQNELEALITEQNVIKSRGITPQLLNQAFIEKWDGKTPLYGNLPVTLFKKE